MSRPTRPRSPPATCPRRNDLDGRGHLSEEALAGFTRFFLGVCIDQVDFMERLVAPDRLRNRILIWVEEEVRSGALPPKSGAILEAVLFRGELPRGDVAGLLGTGGAAGPPGYFRLAGPRNPAVGKLARAPSPRLPRKARIPLDARNVSGLRGLEPNGPDATVPAGYITS